MCVLDKPIPCKSCEREFGLYGFKVTQCMRKKKSVTSHNIKYLSIVGRYYVKGIANGHKVNTTVYVGNVICFECTTHIMDGVK